MNLLRLSIMVSALVVLTMACSEQPVAKKKPKENPKEVQQPTKEPVLNKFVEKTEAPAPPKVIKLDPVTTKTARALYFRGCDTGDLELVKLGFSMDPEVITAKYDIKNSLNRPSSGSYYNSSYLGIHRAAMFAQLNVLEFLITIQDINTREFFRDVPPLGVLVDKFRTDENKLRELIRFFVENGADTYYSISAKESYCKKAYNKSSLRYAFDYTAVDELLKLGVDPNQVLGLKGKEYTALDSFIEDRKGRSMINKMRKYGAKTYKELQEAKGGEQK